jgi:hypothetical protein
MISGFFEDASRLHPDRFPAGGPWNYREVEDALRGLFMRFDPDLDYTCGWFDNEIRPVLDIDVYGAPFPHDRGYCRFDNANFHLLVLRYEDLAETFGAATREFFQLDKPLKLLRANDSRDKPYAETYSRTLNAFRLPESICRAVYSTRFARHFYSEQDRRALFKRWIG